MALGEIGRREQAVNEAVRMEATAPPVMRGLVTAARCLIEGQRDRGLTALEEAVRCSTDPEPLFYCARQFARLGKPSRALELLRGVCDGGYGRWIAISRDAWFGSLRGDPEFETIAARQRERHDLMAAAFDQAGGPGVLGVPAPLS